MRAREIFARALVCPVLVFLEKVEHDVHRVRLIVEAVLPDAENIRVFVDERVVCENLAVLVNRVHIEYEHPARADECAESAECLSDILGLGQMIDAVERAERGVNFSEKVEILHLLARNRIFCPSSKALF